MIRQITLVTSVGVQTYTVGGRMPGTSKTIVAIRLEPLYFTGDPFDHYIGSDECGERLFSIYPLCPCVVEYE